MTDFTITVRGEELDIALVPIATSGTTFKRYAINVSHPDGGDASFEVLDYRGFQIGQCTSDDCPTWVGGIVRKMDRLWARALVGSDTRAETLFARAVILYRNRTEAA